MTEILTEEGKKNYKAMAILIAGALIAGRTYSLKYDTNVFIEIPRPYHTRDKNTLLSLKKHNRKNGRL